MTNQELGRWIIEQVFEIRYKPNARILDYRGTLAESMADAMTLPHWRIGDNRVDIFDEGEKNRCFIGFSNAGFVSLDAPTANYFGDQVLKFFRKLLSLEAFAKPVFTQRLGLRGKFLIPHEGKFEDLLTRYAERYLKLTELAAQEIKGKLVDIGGNLNFEDEYGNFNTVSGPMTGEQISKFFQWREKEEIPKLGLYYDIDYWIRPSKELSETELLRTIGTFAREVWNKVEGIRRLIMGG